MLEVKTYSIQEMREILKSETKKQIDKKLNRYAVEFEVTGRGEKVSYTIKKFNDPFKVFCITELDFKAQTNFKLLLYFMYHFFCDEVFMSLPDNRKEKMMDCYNHYVSRQTIAKYENQLIKVNYVAKTGECYYYFATKDTMIMTTKETYCEAWDKYWEYRALGEDGFMSMQGVKRIYGGAPEKRYIIQENAFFLEKINTLITIIKDAIEKELEAKEKQLE